MAYFRPLHAGASARYVECIEYTSHLSDWTYGIFEDIKVAFRSRNLKKDKQYNDQEKGKKRQNMVYKIRRIPRALQVEEVL